MRSRLLLLAALLGLTTGCNELTGVNELEIAQADPGAGAPKAVACTYPMENLGTQKGQVPPPDLVWRGYAEGSSEPTTLAIADYLDCDGSKGINALMIEQSAGWCPPCKGLSRYLQKQVTGEWAGLGIQVLTLMVEGIELHTPATVESAAKWREELELPDLAVAADPGFTFRPSEGEYGYPTPLLIDPRTMTIVEVEGHAIDGAVELAKKNMPAP